MSLNSEFNAETGVQFYLCDPHGNDLGTIYAARLQEVGGAASTAGGERP